VDQFSGGGTCGIGGVGRGDFEHAGDSPVKAGNQENVSPMRSAVASQIQTLAELPAVDGVDCPGAMCSHSIVDEDAGYRAML
jgi:hypothetical protein